MLLGAIFRCLDPVLTVAASLSYKSPFVSKRVVLNSKLIFLFCFVLLCFSVDE